MKQLITKCQFSDAFRDCGRQDQFSYDYLEDYEEETGCDVELDVIALCCEYTEYGSADEAASNYFDYEGMEYDEEDGGELITPEEVEDKALNYLQDRTSVIIFDTGCIIQDF